jgi:hypothetical protein
MDWRTAFGALPREMVSKGTVAEHLEDNGHADNLPEVRH